MEVFGHQHIPSPKFVKVSAIEDIEKLNSDEIPYVQYNDAYIELIKNLHENSITYAVQVFMPKDYIIASKYQPTYFIVGTLLVKGVQKYVDTYMLDTKVLQVIKNELEMVRASEEGIDGVVFNHILD